MFTIDHPEMIKLAMKKSGLNQDEIARRIGKSQAQVSKYLNKASIPPEDAIIHFMNIIASYPPDEGHFFELLMQVYTLNGEQHKEFRVALTKTICAYRAAASLSSNPTKFNQH